jgi:cation transport regulator ChaC|tara:strand:+ start:157 stop:609 length:453 start_codon:yes stop_codon:yes gene_type:complete
MNQQMLYFAYGSNLNRQQMESRCPGSKYIKNYYRKGYKLSFSWKPTRRQSTGVANIVKKVGSKVPGVIYKIKPKHRKRLRKCEGYPSVYNENFFLLNKEKVLYYIMDKGFISKRPSKDYVEIVKKGYEDRNLDIVFLRRRLSHYHIEIKK